MPSSKRFAGALAVASLAIALRLPSVTESFWIDELHSAWAVAGSFSEVAGRAAAGNQFPLYFWLLWGWQAIFGSSELAMRASSILAVAAASGLFVLGPACPRRIPIAGLVAGLLLAAEPNAIFFGTELRPYGAVMLCSAVGGVSLWQLQCGGDRRWAFALAASTALAASLQPATVAVMVVLPLVALFAQREGAVTLRLCIGCGLAAAIPIAIGYPVTRQVWLERDNWAAFAIPQSIIDLWRVWSWTDMVVVPVVACGMMWLFRRWRVKPTAVEQEAVDCRKDSLRLAAIMTAAVVVAVVGHWLAAWLEWVPLWHRRYLIAGLPVLCLAAGHFWQAASLRPRIVGVAAFAFLVSLFAQRPHYPRVWRGEDWRGAVAFLNAERKSGEPVYVAAQLIESHAFVSDDADPALARYLTFPVRGPYRVAGPLPLGVDRDLWQTALRRNDAAWLIGRLSVAAAEDFTREYRMMTGDDLTVYPFGNVILIHRAATR